jgi:hypothetical protein
MCPICFGVGWVCEVHRDEPWHEELGCRCGKAAMRSIAEAWSFNRAALFLDSSFSLRLLRAYSKIKDQSIQ